MVGSLLSISLCIMSQWELPGSDLTNAIRIANMISHTAVMSSGCSFSNFLPNKNASDNTKDEFMRIKKMSIRRFSAITLKLIFWGNDFTYHWNLDSNVLSADNQSVWLSPPN